MYNYKSDIGLYKTLSFFYIPISYNNNNDDDDDDNIIGFLCKTFTPKIKGKIASATDMMQHSELLGCTYI